MQTELKAVEILKEILENEKQAMAEYEKLSNIAYIEEALAELAEITQEKSCDGCELEDYIKPNFTPNGCAKCNRNPNSKLKDHYTPKG